MDVTAVVLAGGRGSRIGGDKALVQLGGRPLISYPIEAAQAAGLEVIVVAKRTTVLPHLAAPLLLEPDEPTHPLLGIITALDRYPAIIAIPCDMPFVDPGDLAALAETQADLAALSTNQPFPSLYRRGAVEYLRDALEASRSMRSTHAHSRRVHEVASSADSATQMSINTAADLAAAEEHLRRTG